jgi:hypothetical protein
MRANPPLGINLDWDRIRFLEDAFPRTSKTDMLLDEIGTLFEDWETFFIFYTLNAPPPLAKQEEIQHMFKVVRKQYKKCLEQYKGTLIKCINDIVLPPHTNKHIISHAKGKKRVIKEEKDDNDYAFD